MKKNIRDKVKNFHKLWNTDSNEGKKLESFKNRVLTTLNMIVGPIFAREENSNLLIKYFKFIGKYIDPEMLYRGNGWKMIYIGDNKFKDTIKREFNSATLVDVIQYLQWLFYLDIGQDVKDKLCEEVKEDMDLSLLNIQIKKVNNIDYVLYPVGAKLLDESIVNDVLDWLVDYSEVYDKFKSALEKYENHKYARNLIDDLRLSLELLLKRILNNKKPLEKQKMYFGKYLKEKKVSKEIRNMLSQQISYYIDYQNEHAKHNDSINEYEIEFMIYLTGTFMRFILNLEMNIDK